MPKLKSLSQTGLPPTSHMAFLQADTDDMTGKEARGFLP